MIPRGLVQGFMKYEDDYKDDIGEQFCQGKAMDLI